MNLPQRQINLLHLRSWGETQANECLRVRQQLMYLGVVSCQLGHSQRDPFSVRFFPF